ncbi:MAG: nicotinate (nicotinamide) nucleotide adenylyltransferase [Treponema sp.]|nr:nicotinate (nicotinamide) nucleotide adenylyltransferase [Treponema sp.]
MKIAVLGGSFNPFHIGHAMLADRLVDELHYDKVLIVPACNPPHKKLSAQIDAEHRLAMIQAFCESEKRGCFIPESCEIDRGGTSYTCDTLEHLTQKYKDKLEGKLAFVMGDEVAAEFHKWKNPEKVSELADLIITRRYPEINILKETQFHNNPSGSYNGDFKEAFDLNAFKYPCIYLEEPLLPVSSTEIRTRIAENKSFKYLVPGAVYDYILNHKLYLQ